MFDVALTHRPACRLAGLPHTGPYAEISGTFAHLFALLEARNAMQQVRGMTAAYLDDPATKPAAKLNSFATVVVDDSFTPAPPLQSLTLAEGDHAVLLFKGPYDGLPAAYDYLYGTWLAQSGRKAAASPSFENYLNSPQDTPPGDLLTEICLPLAPA